jgi:hypothetical protein
MCSQSDNSPQSAAANSAYKESHKLQDALDTLVPSEPILQFFSFAHLPVTLQVVSEPFCKLATGMVLQLPRNPERTVALRKLLEAKDAAVRAKIYK